MKFARGLQTIPRLFPFNSSSSPLGSVLNGTLDLVSWVTPSFASSFHCDLDFSITREGSGSSSSSGDGGSGSLLLLLLALIALVIPICFVLVTVIAVVFFLMRKWRWRSWMLSTVFLGTNKHLQRAEF